MLEIKNVHKVFHQNTIDEKVVFQDFQLTVQDGQFVSIIGTNGSGKSTLFQLISGHLAVDQGQIILDGQKITHLKPYVRSKVIGQLFQNPLLGTAPSMTIEQNLALAYLRAGKKRMLSTITKKDQAFFADVVKRLDMGLEDRLHTPVGLLSGGQRQALTLLMATIVPPKVLLLDEHIAALDPASAKRIMELTKMIVEEHHMTCLMITHHLPSALQYGNRLLMMNQGKIVMDVADKQKQELSIDDVMHQFVKHELLQQV